MNLSLSEQIAGFLFALAAGIFLGAFYDVFRVLRSMLNSKKSHVFFQDLLYMAVSAVVTFLVALAYSDGRIRFYLLLGEAAGWCVWHFTIGRVTVGACRFFFRLVRRHVVQPIRGLLLKWGRLLKRALKKAKENRKKNHQNREKSLKRRGKILYNQDAAQKSRRKRKKTRKDGAGS